MPTAKNGLRILNLRPKNHRRQRNHLFKCTFTEVTVKYYKKKKKKKKK